MTILSTSDRDIAIAAAALARGELVAFPTETVYGLGADAFDPDAVARIFEAKGRPSFDPLIVHIASPSDLGEVADVPEGLEPERWRRVETLVDGLWPGPLTLVLPKRGRVPGIVTSGLDTVAVRCPAHPVARALIAAAGRPIAAPSANPFGYLSPTCAQHVAESLGDRIDFLVDGGPCPVGVESTVLDLSGPEPVVLRPGGMDIAAIEALVGPVMLYDRSREEEGFQDGQAPASPGQLPSHYAPRRSLYLLSRGALAGEEAARTAADLEGMADRNGGGSGKPVLAALAFDTESAEAARASGLYARVECLVPTACADAALASRMAAGRLFALLHELDHASVDAIVAERAPDAGLGAAINDRLYKASRKQG